MGHAGVKPNVERIGDLFVLLGLIAQELTRLKFKPRVNAFSFDTGRDVLDQRNAVRVQATVDLVDE